MATESTSGAGSSGTAGVATTAVTAPEWAELDVSIFPPGEVTLLGGDDGLLLRVRGHAGDVVGVSTDGGRTWDVQAQQGLPVQAADGWSLYRPPATSTGVVGGTQRLVYQDGTWSVASEQVPGLDVDTVVTDAVRYLRWPVNAAFALHDGGVAVLGDGAYWKSFSTGDDTSWLGLSVDGAAFTVTALDHPGNDRFDPRIVADGPAGPVIVGVYSTSDGDHVRVWSTATGLPVLFDAHIAPPLYGADQPDVPRSEALTVEGIYGAADSSGYHFLVIGTVQQERVLREIASTDGTEWAMTDIALEEWTNPLVRGMVVRDGVVTALVSARNATGPATLLLTASAGQWSIDPVGDLDGLEPKALAVTSTGTMAVVATGADGGLHLFVRDV